MYRELITKQEAIKIIDGRITKESTEAEIREFMEKIIKTHTRNEVAGVANYIYYGTFKPTDFNTLEFMEFMEKVSDWK